MSKSLTDILDPSVSNYVLPKPPRGAGESLLVAAAPGAAMATNQRRAETARGLGGRFLGLIECQQQFLVELRERLQALDVAMAEDSRARLKGSLRGAMDVLEWCDVVQNDLQKEGRMAAAGWLPHDLAEFCREVANGRPAGATILVPSTSAPVWWGDGSALFDAMLAGVTLVAERTAGRGPIQLEAGGTATSAWVRIAGVGDPVEEVEPASVRRFRLAVEKVGARVGPDQLGGAAAALVLHLPVAAD